jgi:large subunit ribosomal protein L9
MKVLMNETLENVGRLGDIVEVKAGFARNFLFPKKLAIQPTKHNLDIMKFKKIKAQKQLELEKLSAVEQKEKIEALTMTISKKSGESDTLFGSVTPAEIHETLEKLGFSIDKKKFHLEEPIKKLGHHECKIRLMEDVEAVLKIEVVKEIKEGEETTEDKK